MVSDNSSGTEIRSAYMSVDSHLYTRVNHIYSEGLQLYTHPERVRIDFASSPAECNYPKEILEFLNTIPGTRINSSTQFRKEDPELFYRIIRAIKANSCYIVEDHDTNIRRVLKKVYCYSSRGNAVAESEANLARSMEHDNVLRTFEVYKYNKTIWQVQELMNISAKELLETVDTLEEPEVAFILREVCKGLVYMHNRGIMHRDIKAENILLSIAGEVKIADFSYAAEMHTETRETFVGSPGWLAPEMLGGKHDFKVDVWSLGVLGIELAEKQLPFVDERPVYTVYSVISGPVPALTKSAEWSEDFQNFLGQCLQKRPRLRPCVKDLLLHPFLMRADSQKLICRMSDLAEIGLTN